jgi:hypothetical protein
MYNFKFRRKISAKKTTGKKVFVKILLNLPKWGNVRQLLNAKTGDFAKSKGKIKAANAKKNVEIIVFWCKKV